MEQLLSAESVHTITVESGEDGYGIFLDGALVSRHRTLNLAQFGAFLAAHRLNRGLHRLELEPDEVGNLVAVFFSAE